MLNDCISRHALDNANRYGSRKLGQTVESSPEVRRAIDPIMEHTDPYAPMDISIAKARPLPPRNNAHPKRIITIDDDNGLQFSTFESKGR